jgi:2-oxoglutarate ferredoxin oxidoreductase subunit delta
MRLGLAAPTVPTAGILAAPADVAAPGPIGRFAVAIDAQRCSGCLACAGVCPHRALTVETDARGTACALVVEAEACTGCRLCEVACDDAALTVHSLAAQRAARLELTPVTCPSCREVHHRPAASTVRCARRAPSPRVLVLKDSP